MVWRKPRVQEHLSGREHSRGEYGVVFTWCFTGQCFEVRVCIRYERARDSTLTFYGLKSCK